MDLLSVKFGKAKVEMTDTSAGDVFICSPERSLAKSLGIIFGVIELNGISDEFNDVFLEIINDLKTEYYLPPFHVETGPEKRFEECIQRANRRIHKAINESIEAVDLDSINALIGLSFKNSIHMAYSGKVVANLLHMRKDGNLVGIDILENTGEKKLKSNGEKIFHDITSGQISGRDVVFILSENASKYITSPDLINAVENNPLSLAGEIEGVLRSQSQDDNFYLLTIEPDYERIDSMETQVQSQKRVERTVPATPPEHSLNNLLTTQRKTERYLTPSSMPSWKKVLLLTVKGIGKTCAYLYPKFKNVIAYIAKKLFKLTAALLKKIFKKGKAPMSLIDKNPRPADFIDTPNEELMGELQEPGVFSTISKWINKVLEKIAILKKSQKIILLIVFILIFAFSESVVLMGKGSEPIPPKASQVSANQIEDKINLAEAQNIFSDGEGAKTLIIEAQQLLNKIPKKKSNLALIDTLQKKIDSTRMTIQKISSIENPQLLFDLNQVNNGIPAEAIALTGQNIIVSGGQGGNICQIDLTKKQVLSSPLSQQGLNVSKISPIDATNLLLLDSAQGVFKYAIKATSSEGLIPATQIADLSYYLGNIYLLDKSKSQIVKYQIKKGKATGATTALKDNANLNQANSFAVNGDFFIFKDNGEIKKYSKGALTDIKYEMLDPVLKSPVQLIADSHDYLYVLDKTGNKIAIFDDKGGLKVQITSPKFTSIKSMALNEKEKKIYLLSDNKIFVINTGI
ncbi:MAG: hypothetical protein WCV92_01965 [Candidatus Buchananbacteria bacterium]